MPHRFLSVDAVAEYLHLTPADVERRVKDQAIPCERRGDRVVFRKSDIDAWASRRILGLPGPRLAAYHEKSTRGTRRWLPEGTLLPEALRRGGVSSAMAAKTKASVLRDLVALAEKTGQVCDARELLASLEAREELGSTALPGGFALPHPRFQQPYLFEASFVVVGRTIQEIHFGAPDGRPTDLFFLICGQDDRLHLHTLARFCLMARNTDVLNQLRQAPDPESMRDCLIAAEQQVLPDHPHPPA